MQRATESTVHGDFNDARFVYGDVATTFTRKDGKFIVRTDGPDGALEDYEAKFTFGVSPLEQYLLELPGGRLQALTIAWDSSRKRAAGSGGFTCTRTRRSRPATRCIGPSCSRTGTSNARNVIRQICAETTIPTAAPTRRAFGNQRIVRNLPWTRLPACLMGAQGRWLAGAGCDQGPCAVSLDERRDVSWTLDPMTGNSARCAPRQTTREIETCAHCHSRRGPIWADVWFAILTKEKRL